jgi:hypothetical protein
MRTSTSAASSASASTTLSYRAPVIAAFSPVPTAGGVATITVRRATFTPLSPHLPRLVSALVAEV